MKEPMNMTPKAANFQFIECSGTPREMGRQYGEAAREAIRTNLQSWRPGGSALAWDAYVKDTTAFLTRHAPEVLDELKGVAEGSGASLEALVVENAAGSPRPSECTSMAIPNSRDGAILGKNNDGAVDERCWVLRRTKPVRGLPMLHFVSAGWLSGLDAMNGSGLANGHNSVGSSLGRVPGSIEIRLWAYHLMARCSTSEEFLQGLLSVPLNGKGFNVVTADAGRNGCVLECAVPKVVPRGLGEPFVYATNHYITDALKDADGRTPDQKQISIYRYGYLAWQDRMHRPGDEGDIRRLLKSHEPWAPCRHGQAHQSHTLWSIIAAPEQGRMDAAFGPPCTQEYTRYKI
jgi:isopenicillin-N N-acyltransferase like protein